MTKTLKSSPRVHDMLVKTAAHYGFTVQDFTDHCIKFACNHFQKNGLTLEPMDIKDDPEYREKLVGDSIAMSKQGIEKYSEWLAMLTPDQQEILKHCTKVHKEAAVTASHKQKIRASEPE